MNIDEAISSARTFGDIQRVAAVSSAHLSFWGSKYITADGFEGSADIDAIAYRTMEMLKQVNYEFNELERVQGKLLSDKIEELYRDVRIQKFDAGYFTLAITLMRMLVTQLFEYYVCGRRNTEYEWHGLGQVSNEDFMCYTRTQFVNRFSFQPEEAELSDNLELVPASENRPERWRCVYCEQVRRARRS